LTSDKWHLCTVCRHFCFEKISPDLVDQRILERAADVASFVCKDLKLDPPPAFVWVRPADPVQVRALGFLPRDTYQEERSRQWFWLKERTGDLKAGCTPGRKDLREVWIRSDLDAYPDLEFVVAHELATHGRNSFTEKHSMMNLEQKAMLIPMGIKLSSAIWSRASRLHRLCEAKSSQRKLARGPSILSPGPTADSSSFRPIDLIQIPDHAPTAPLHPL